ncbi:MAG: hypothetical protein IJT86_03890, partial [Spirochaetales bacterium]|nr:hypothetical protein [Spirochaetales bacterium]
VYASFPQMFESLKGLDQKVNQAKEDPKKSVTKAEMYLSLVRPFISVDKSIESPMEIFNDILRQIKILLSPITPPNYEIESAAALYMRENGLKVPKGAIRHRNPDAPVQRTERKGASVAGDGQESKKKKRRQRHKRVAKKETDA